MWPYVGLGGMSHTIPPVCPNCLAEAHERVVCQHKDLVTCFFYPFGPAGQTFLYCEACAEQARAGVRCDRLRRFLVWGPALILLGLGILLLLAPVIGRDGVLALYLERLPRQVALGVRIVAVVVVWWLIAGAYRRLQRRRHPKTEAQAVWGVAAYYSSFSNYKAARPEWIEALVRCNPELVKDKVYRRITGEEKPE